MDGFLGFVWLKMHLEDTIGIMTKSFEVKCLVYKELNHDMIIGQDSMVLGLNSFTCFPGLDVILFNATSRMYKKFNTTVRDKIRVLNNIKQRVHTPELIEKVMEMNGETRPPSKSSSSETTPPVNVKKTQFDENESFYLTIPGSIFKEKIFNKLNPTVQNITSNFMESMEDADKHETALAKVLTEGGLDEFIDKNPIKVTDSKILKTSKGDQGWQSALRFNV